MIDCSDSEMREALPDFVHGRLSALDWATMSAHVDGCASCAKDVALLREVRRTAPLAPAINVGRVVAALPAPPARLSLRSQATSRVRRRDGASDSATPVFPGRRAVWAMAATVAVMVAGGLSVVNRGDYGDRKSAVNATMAQSSGAGGPVEVASPAGTILSTKPGGTPDAAAVRKAGAVAAIPTGAQRDIAASPRVALTLVAGVDELSDAHIERLLSEMDEMEDMPASEPDPVAIGLENLEGGA